MPFHKLHRAIQVANFQPLVVPERRLRAWLPALYVPSAVSGDANFTVRIDGSFHQIILDGNREHAKQGFGLVDSCENAQFLQNIEAFLLSADVNRAKLDSTADVLRSQVEAKIVYLGHLFGGWFVAAKPQSYLSVCHSYFRSKL